MNLHGNTRLGLLIPQPKEHYGSLGNKLTMDTNLIYLKRKIGKKAVPSTMNTITEADDGGKI